MKKLFIGLFLSLFSLGNFSDTAFAHYPALQNQPAFNSKEMIYRQSSHKIDTINPTVTSNVSGAFYPGQRGANQLIIYTKEYGERTGTNEFGSEAIVVNGIVTQLFGADSIIPNNGYVISGHGLAKNWINENITVGTKVYVDETNLTIKTFITPQSFIFGAEEKIKEVLSIMHYYEMNNPCYDRTEAELYLKKAKQNLQKASQNPNDVQKYAAAAGNMANKAIETALPYYPNEFKGVWIRPIEKTERQVESTLDRLKKAGINNVFLETYFHGKTIYPSSVLTKYGLANQREEFVGFDPLEVWIREAHKRNIKIHVWFESFYVGNKYNPADKTNIINAYPHWLNKTKKTYDSEDPVPSVSEHNGYFIDPANPEVQQYLSEILNEIVFKYKPDGINLDYIRYPQSIQEKFPTYEDSNWGYTNFARAEFKSLYNVDPLNIKKETTDWALWAKYRQDKITNFVKDTRKLTKANKIFLTTVIFPDRQRSLETKMQDWKTWSVQNYVDGFTPLILTCDKQTASMLISDIQKNSSRLTNIYPGLFVTFMGGATDDLLRQVHETRKLSMSGFILFDYAHFEDKYIDVLKSGAFNIKNYNEPEPVQDISKNTSKKRLKNKN